MKLSKLYCNKPFKNIIFNTRKGGFNIILADVKAKKKDGDTHNVGKTTLIELIDFLLLKKIDNKHFLMTSKTSEGQPLFKDYIFYLEILLNNGKYVTICRSVITPTKISFKLSEKPSEGFMEYRSWDYKDIAIEKAQALLNNFLNFDFCKRTIYEYRKVVNYSLRMQGDYDNIFQLKKFAKGKDKEWKPFMFDLLGFNGTRLRKKYDLEDTIKEQSKVIKEQEKDFDIKASDKDKIVGQIQIKEQERNELANVLDSFNFYQQDRKIISELAEQIENEISDLNRELYNTEFDIQRLEQSIKNEFAFDLPTVKRLFEEVKLHFPNQLEKSYEELIEFNKKITQERNSQIRETLREKTLQSRAITERLIELNKKKEHHKDIIQDTSLFKKYKEYQKQLRQIETDLVRLESQLEAFNLIETKNKEIKEVHDNELQETKAEIEDEISSTLANQQYTSIRKTFGELVRQILMAPAIISVSLNTHGNISFDYEIEKTAQKRGYTYNKLLCVAFDLAILMHYSTESFFRFVYHDDVFANADNRIKIKLLKILRELTEKYDIQYIFTIIKDDMPTDEPFEFQQQEVILELHDKGNEGKLFLMDF